MLRCATLIQVLAASTIIPLAAATALAQAPKPSHPPLTNLKLPVAFEPNQGQAPQVSRFVARAANASLSLRPLGMDFEFRTSLRASEGLSIDFVNADPGANIEAVDRQPSESNYILGRDSGRWHTHIPNYSRVKYDGLYPGIDLVVYGTGQEFEHDFVVAPGGNLQRIKMRLEGAKQITIAADGSARVALAGGTLILRRPDVYQPAGSARSQRRGRFALLAKNEIVFAIGPYDHSRPLIIDPVLSYSTYVADTFLYFGAATADASGNTYIAGQVFGTYPVTPGAFQQTCASCAAQLPDAVITKLNPEGTSAVYSTYLGGSDYDQPFGIAVDSQGDAIVTGYTESADFPVKNPVSSGFPGVGTRWAFITSLSPDGSSLNYSSIIGGGAQPGDSSSTYENGVALDSDGSAYLTGWTDSSVFPVTPGALNNVAPAYPKNVVYVTKFLTDGTIGYSAFLGDAAPQNGGGGFIGPTAIAVDSEGSAYVTGAAGSLWPTSSGAYQTSIPGTAPYAAPFVAKMSPDASSLSYSTFLGDQGVSSGITVDADGDAFVTGNNVSSNYPTTPNAFEGPIPADSCCPAFVSELDAAGAQLLYSSFFYGSFSNGPFFTTTQAITLDASGDIWLAGFTGDPQLPLAHPLLTIPSSAFGSNLPNGFVTEFNPGGNTVLFSTFFAGPMTGSQVLGIALDSSGIVHFAGLTGDDLFTTPGAYLPAVTPPQQGNDNFGFAFAAAIDPNGSAPLLCISYPANAGLVLPGIVGTGASQTLTITNCGTLSLNISSIQSSNPVFSVPANLNGCSQPVAAGASCTLTVSFAPTMSGNVSALLTLQSNAPIPETILPLLGLGLAPEVSVQPSSLSFGPTPVGQTSPNQDVLVGNIGTLEMNVDLVHTTISQGFAFTQIGCDVPIQPSQDCEFSVTFTPSTAGNISGMLKIATDDPTTPRISVSLSGVAVSTDFSFGSGGSGATSQTVAAGATATYNLSLTAATGYSGTVTFTCSNVPANASCTVQPSSIPLTSGQSANFAVSVATQTAAAAPNLNFRPGFPIGLIVLGLLAATVLACPRRPVMVAFARVAPLPLLLIVALGIAVGIFACGGVNSGGNSGSTQKTPAGTYTLQLTATDGTHSHSESLTLIVK